MSKEEAASSSLGKGRVGLREAVIAGFALAGVHEVELKDGLWSGPCAVKEVGGAEIF